MATRFTTHLLGSEECADMLTLRFSRPEGFDPAAGQYVLLKLEGHRLKPFTCASAPSDSHIEITTRDSGSPFKVALSSMSEGDVAHITGPMGRFVLPASPGRVLMLAGGIGITPIRSIMRDTWQHGRSLCGMLIYGNRSIECIPYWDELEELGGGELRVVHVLEQPPDGWGGETGLVTVDVAARHMDSFKVDLAIVAGPPAMVEAMEQVLDELAIPASCRMIERFGRRG